MFGSGNFDFFVNIGTYKPKYVLIRSLVISVSAIIIIYITGVMTKWELLPAELKLTIYTIAVLAFNSVTEVNLFIIRLFRKWERFGKSLYIQILSVFAVTLLLIFAWIQLAEKLLGEVNLLTLHVTQIVLIIGLLIILIHILIIILSNLTRDYLNSRKEIDELTQAKLMSDYNQLRDRLNPHFLFNNLSVLKSLIHYSPDDAEVFTENFTNVYRYMLKCHDQKTVLLQEEVKFLHSYIALHKERIGEGLQVSIHIKDSDLQKELPPMALQLLVENAIKHNAVNRNHPLTVEITSDDNSISVQNNLNKKDTTYSTQTGLKTLDAQYKMLAGKSISVKEDGSVFTVTLPLL
ncbi:sensor histidine kinase [Saccharicrinis sp. FJH62]|uniref:sensor histidine kinase n=1 Tax=Saccharicrinis sp. FJH62 TaxID=3344657 RepID=UPI0035D45D04